MKYKTKILDNGFDSAQILNMQTMFHRLFRQMGKTEINVKAVRRSWTGDEITTKANRDKFLPELTDADEVVNIKGTKFYKIPTETNYLEFEIDDDPETLAQSLSVIRI